MSLITRSFGKCVFSASKPNGSFVFWQCKISRAISEQYCTIFLIMLLQSRAAKIP